MYIAGRRCLHDRIIRPAHPRMLVRAFFEWGFFGGENRTLPANTIGVSVYAMDIGPDSGITGTIDFTVELLEEGWFRQLPEHVISVKAFGGAYVVAPQEGLKMGSTYRFTGNSITGDRGPDEGRDKQVTITVSPAGLSAEGVLPGTSGRSRPNISAWWLASRAPGGWRLLTPMSRLYWARRCTSGGSSYCISQLSMMNSSGGMIAAACVPASCRAEAGWGRVTTGYLQPADRCPSTSMPPN